MLYACIILTMTASWCAALLSLYASWRARRPCEPSVLTAEEQARLLAVVPGRLEMRERGAAALRGERG